MLLVAQYLNVPSYTAIIQAIEGKNGLAITLSNKFTPCRQIGQYGDGYFLRYEAY